MTELEAIERKIKILESLIEAKNNPPGLTIERIRKMTPEQINQIWGEISEFLSKQGKGK